MAERDDAAAAFYEDPERRRLAGPGRRRPGQARRLSTHVPVRFSAAIIERVKELAADDGKTVSSWIRDVVEREVLRRERSRSLGTPPAIQYVRTTTAQPGTSTVTSSSKNIDLDRLAS